MKLTQSRHRHSVVDRAAARRLFWFMTGTLR